MTDQPRLPYRTTGRVVRGAGRGRTLGFPTANLDTSLPGGLSFGIYAGWTLIDSEAVTSREHTGSEAGNLSRARSRDHTPGVKEAGHGPERHPTLIYWGRRPTFDGGAPVLELFLLDHSDDDVAPELTVELIAFLRPDQRFETPAALITAMEQDVAKGRQLLKAD